MDDNTPINPTDLPDVSELNTRRNLIKSLYHEVLGREADINGLSYYTVHKEISEDVIRKQMSQSTDHRDIILKSQKYPELEKRCIELEDQVIRLQNANAEKDSLITNLRAVTSSMHTTTGDPKITSTYAMDMMQNPSNQNIQSSQNTPNQNNNNSKKPNGCVGVIKKFLGV